MDLLVWFVWLVYGGDVGRLGSPEFEVRHAAHGRLCRAGWLAYPALAVGRRDANPERAHRLGILMARQWTAWEAVAVAVVRCPGLPDDVVRSVGAWAAREDELAAVLYPLVDRTGGFWVTDSRAWAESLPYVTGSREKEYGHVLLTARFRTVRHPVAPPPRLAMGDR